VFVNRPEFRELLLSQCGARGQVDTRKVGQWLKRISGRLYDGYTIVLGRADKHDKVQRIRGCGPRRCSAVSAAARG
jgi:hypothetical protein